MLFRGVTVKWTSKERRTRNIAKQKTKEKIQQKIKNVNALMVEGMDEQ